MKHTYCKGRPVSAKQLKMGVRVEREHTKSPKVARKIACDHLLEFPGKPYYTELAKLERRLKRMK